MKEKKKYMNYKFSENLQRPETLVKIEAQNILQKHYF